MSIKIERPKCNVSKTFLFITKQLAHTHLVQLVGTLAAKVVQAGQYDHWFCEHLQTDGTNKLLLQSPQRVPVVGAHIQWNRHDPKLTAKLRR